MMMVMIMIFTYCNWGFTQCQWSVNLYKNRTETAQKEKQYKTQKTQNKKKEYKKNIKIILKTQVE